MRYRWTFPLQSLCLGVLLTLASMIPVAAQSRPQVKISTLQDRHSKFYQSYRQQLEDLANRCRQKQLTDGVTEIQQYLTTPTGAMIQMVSLGPEFEPELPADLTPDQRQWRVELRELRKDYAKKLYELSRQAVNNGHPGFAFSNHDCARVATRWRKPAALAAEIVARNSQLKWCDTSQRGYMAVELTPKSATSEWRFLATVRKRGTALAGTKRMTVLAGQRRFTPS